jgi:lysophospholipase L1-like esterase
MPQLFLFGDSITWGAWDPEAGGFAQSLRMLIDQYQAGRSDFWCPVYNLGIPGDTSKGVAHRLSQEVIARREEKEEAFLLIAIGINDSISHLQDSASDVSVESYTENLNGILKQACKLNCKIAFLGLTPVDEARVCPIPWDQNKAYRLARCREFHLACEDFCKTHKLPFLSLWDSWIKSKENLLYDGVHPNTEGHRVLFQAVKRFLVENRFLPEVFA